MMTLGNCYPANVFNGEIRPLTSWHVKPTFHSYGVSPKACWPTFDHFPLPVDATEIAKIAGPEFNIPTVGPGDKLGTWRTHIYEDSKPIWPIGLTFGYAATVHKSQGSEWDHVAIVDDCPRRNSMRRSWLYTAITRARKTLTIIDTTK